MLDPEQERHRKFIALGSGGRPIGSLLNPYDAINTSRTPSLRSDAYGSTDSLSSCESTPLICLHSTPSSTTTSSSITTSSSTTTTSSSADQTSARRRPAYKEEELCFIWYHRVDLKKAWVDVQCAFNAQFPTRQRSGVQGIQYGFYRYSHDTWKVPKMKHLSMKVGEEYAKKYGLRQWMKKSYPWMKEGEVVS